MSEQKAVQRFRQRTVYNGRPAYYDVYTTGPMKIPNSGPLRLFSEDEEGVLIGFIAHVTSNNMGMKITLADQSGAEYEVINGTVKDILRLGMGSTPGDIETLPNNESPDPVCVPHPIYPYISRYKATTEADAIADTGQEFVIAYEPVIPKPYSRIRAFVLNLAGKNRDVRQVQIDKIVYINEPTELKESRGGRVLA